MSKSKKESYKDDVVSTLVRRTIVNAPSSSSRRSEEYDGFSRSSRSKSSDSSPEKKKIKFGKPVARGSETDVIFDKAELKKITITVSNLKKNPPYSLIVNPEKITPIRRPEYSVYGEIKRYEDVRRKGIVEVIRRGNEGKRPIFEKDLKKSKSPERLESSRRKSDSRSRKDFPHYRTRKSRRNSSDSRKHRRNRSTPSRHSCSSDSSCSSTERRKKIYQRHYVSKREREEKLRRDFEREMYYREKERRNNEHRSMPHSNGGKASTRSREKATEEPSKDDKSNHNESYATTQPQNVVRPMYPVRMPSRPPFMMRHPIRPFVPPFGQPYPPHPVGFFLPRPLPPMMLRPMPPRRLQPPRGFTRPS